MVEFVEDPVHHQSVVVEDTAFYTMEVLVVQQQE